MQRKFLGICLYILAFDRYRVFLFWNSACVVSFGYDLCAVCLSIYLSILLSNENYLLIGMSQ